MAHVVKLAQYQHSLVQYHQNSWRIVIYLRVEVGHIQIISLETEEYYLERRKKLYRKLRNTNSADTKIDKKLLESHEENIVKETQALEKIKSNPKHFFAYAKKEA